MLFVYDWRMFEAYFSTYLTMYTVCFTTTVILFSRRLIQLKLRCGLNRHYFISYAMNTHCDIQYSTCNIKSYSLFATNTGENNNQFDIVITTLSQG